MSLLSIWEQAQTVIQEKVGKTSYDTWFTNLRVKETSPYNLIIETPDDFFKNWIVEHYQEIIQNIMKSFVQYDINIEYQVNTLLLKEDEAHQNLYEMEDLQNNQSFSPNQITLNTKFTFDNFVVGASNRFACAASLAVAESPAKAYNPLFIYGQVGLGKTHLIQAITQKLLETNSRLKIRYMTSEKFTNELIDAIRHRSTTEFRKKYREIDVLLIDDVHFIAGKESTQEEFFHTFNYLHNNRKQIIITSDRPPKEISKLEERLSSRFAWGLITDIQPPDFETRVAILKKKVENEPIKVPDDVIFFIAQEIKTNIRELEGALIRVIAYSQLQDTIISLDVTKHILKDMVQQTIKTISMEMVQKEVSGFFNITLSEMRSKRRNKNIVMPRQVAMYLSRQLTNMSLPEIGNAFGGRDHTTVLHSFKKIEAEIKKDENLKKVIHQLTTVLKG